ncbi:trehalose phosphatase, putative [Babesia ovata]|uniref:Trehalose phosphatase, putative n=1 Tax=Babesia ovata TaxID=189622 RepID=A0A2H6K8D6_9APIC|nr:trehalose phosphatase, putative [Babesia ovata]GBE59254.1 trehalose phosphatase, putative [Babesia ovata]
MGDIVLETSVEHDVNSREANSGKRSNSCMPPAHGRPQQRRNSKNDWNPPLDTSTLPAAGLSSSRCTRDFAARCNLLLHSGVKRSPAAFQSTTYERPPSPQKYRGWNHRYGDTAPLSASAEEGSTSPKQSLQGKLRQQYARYNRVFRDPPSEDPPALKQRAPISELEANRQRIMRHCCIFNDTPDSNKQQLERDRAKSPAARPPEDTSPDRSPDEQEQTITDESPNFRAPLVIETTIIGGTRTVMPRNPEWEVVAMRMSCIDPSMSERDIETLAHKADMQVVSIHLDRNIISHLCNGTGTIKCRHTGGEQGLMYFGQLLAKRGIRLCITDLISGSTTNHERS